MNAHTQIITSAGVAQDPAPHRPHRKTDWARAVELRLLWLNNALERPVQPWRNVDGRAVANVGNLHADHSSYGWRIEEQAQGGGVNVPFGHQRMNRTALVDLIDAMLVVIEMAKKLPR
jgi:hypothetical protein